MPSNIYDEEITGPFADFCAGGTDNDGSMESCISFSELASGGFVLGDKKKEGAGRELRFTKEEILTFARGFLAEHDDTDTIA